MHYERVSLARRGGSWRMSYRAVYDAERKGDRKWATIGAAASRAEAEHLAAEYLYNLPRDPEDERRAEAIEATEGRMPTVGELRRDDIDHALAVGAIEKSTHAGYCRHVRLLGDLGEIPVDRVTAQDVQLYVDSLVEDGYCSETVNHMLWTVRDTLELASFRMLRPPLDLRRIRAPKHDRPLPRALSAEEKNALLAALPCIRGPLDAIVRLALFAGLRCGEICALRWANVDLNRRMVRITSAIGTLPSSNGYLKGPKSPAGVRALPIADGLMEGRSADGRSRRPAAATPASRSRTTSSSSATSTARSWCRNMPTSCSGHSCGRSTSAAESAACTACGTPSPPSSSCPGSTRRPCPTGSGTRTPPSR